MFRGEGDDLWAPAQALVVGYVDVGACCEGDDLVAIGEGFADGEGGVADGAGGAEDGEFLHRGYFRRLEGKARGLRFFFKFLESPATGHGLPGYPSNAAFEGRALIVGR